MRSDERGRREPKLDERVWQRHAQYGTLVCYENGIVFGVGVSGGDTRYLKGALGTRVRRARSKKLIYLGFFRRALH